MGAFNDWLNGGGGLKETPIPMWAIGRGAFNWASRKATTSASNQTLKTMYKIISCMVSASSSDTIYNKHKFE